MATDAAPTPAAAAAAGDAGLCEIALTELAAHSDKGDCWMAHNGKVYDVTKFLEDHPGGPEIMLEHAGASPPHRATSARCVATRPRAEWSGLDLAMGAGPAASTLAGDQRRKR